MAKKETIDKVDTQWRMLRPSWGQDDFKGERRLLYESLEEGEVIERLYGCSWEKNEFEKHDRGIVAATDRRILLLNRGRFSKNVADVSYLSIWEVQEQEQDKLIIKTPGYTYNLALERGAGELAGFLRERTTSGEASWEVWLSRMLPSGERVERWALCSADEEKVFEHQESRGENNVGRYHASQVIGSEALAVATDERILFYDASRFTGAEVIPSCPHGSILSAEYWGGNVVRFVNQTGNVYAIDFRNIIEASYFAGLIRQHVGAAAQSVPRETRVSAEWKLQHPIWPRPRAQQARRNHGRRRAYRSAGLV